MSADTPENREKVFQRFSAFDDASGVHIPPSLAINALHKLGYQPSKTQLAKELSIRGPLTWVRFQDVCENQETTVVERNALVEALQVFDREQEGRLPKSVVEEFLLRGDDALSAEELSYAMAFAEEDSFVYEEVSKKNGGVADDKKKKENVNVAHDNKKTDLQGAAGTVEEEKEQVTYINIESFATVLLQGRHKHAAAAAEKQRLQEDEASARQRQLEQEEEEENRKNREAAEERRMREEQQGGEPEGKETKTRSATEEEPVKKKEEGGCCAVM